MPSSDKKILRMLIIEKLNEAFSIKKHFSHYDTPDSSSGISYVFKILSSCREALKYYGTFHPDIIVVKLKSNTQSAIELCEEIRAEEGARHTGIVILQGATLIDPNLAVKFLEAGVDEFIDRKASPREIVARVSTVARFKLINDELRLANHQLLIQSLTDDLTGLHNMRSFEREYKKLFEVSMAAKSGFSIVMVDLDFFKSVNDKENHLVGSHVISEVGKILARECESALDAVPARYGGDEYIICLPAETPQEVMELGETICHKIGQANFFYDDANVKLTASLGFSWMPSGYQGDQETPIKAADLMLYRSKELGRNQVRGILLRNAIDFNHVSRPHLIDRNSSRDNNKVSRLHNFKLF